MMKPGLRSVAQAPAGCAGACSEMNVLPARRQQAPAQLNAALVCHTNKVYTLVLFFSILPGLIRAITYPFFFTNRVKNWAIKNMTIDILVQKAYKYSTSVSRSASRTSITGCSWSASHMVVHTGIADRLWCVLPAVFFPNTIT